MRLEYRNERISITLDGTQYGADVNVVIYAEPGRQQFWTARGRLTGQPDATNELNPKPATKEAGLLMENVGLDVLITTQHGHSMALVAQADVWGHVDIAGTGVPPWPVPNPHVSPI